MAVAEESLRRGDLDGALAALKDAVRNDPADSKLRVFLFQLFAVLGDRERAVAQLKVAGELDAGTLAMVQMYREALRCEAFRDEVFAGRRSPVFFGEPEDWMAWLFEAIKADVNGRPDAAADLRERAFEAAPTTTGTVRLGRPAIEEPEADGHGAEEAEDATGAAFEWIADADSRLGPVFEAIVNGRYYWVPVHRVARLDLEKPEDLRDLVWTPAHFTWANGGDAVGLIPTRYTGTEGEEGADLRLARRTEWRSLGDGTETAFAGVGQRMFATDTGEYPILEVREIVFGEAAASPSGGADG